MAIAYYYDKSKNPREQASIPGVPLDDLTEEQVKEYPAWVRDSIDAHPMYRKTPVPKPAAEKPARVTVSEPPVVGDEPAEKSAPSDDLIADKEAIDG